MVSTAGFVLLDTLITRREATPSELTEETAYSQDHVYRTLDSLLESRLIEESRGQHNQRRVRASTVPLVEAYRRLVGQCGHVQWAEVISPATLRVCWYLDTPRRATTIAERLQISRQAVHDALSPLKGRVMLSPSGPEYALSTDMKPLLAFARAFVTHEHKQRVREHAPSAIVEWCDPKRALVRVQRDEEVEILQRTEEWQVTGLAGFRKFGLTFYLSGQPAFWYGLEEELSAAELIYHTLVLNTEPRRISYGMLLIEAASVEKETLMQAATWYEIESLVEQMYTAIEGEFEPIEETRFPSETEYTTLKTQYGVA
jgi:hypothetical protein